MLRLEQQPSNMYNHHFASIGPSRCKALLLDIHCPRRQHSINEAWITCQDCQDPKYQQAAFVANQPCKNSDLFGNWEPEEIEHHPELQMKMLSKHSCRNPRPKMTTFTASKGASDYRKTLRIASQESLDFSTFYGQRT